MLPDIGQLVHVLYRLKNKKLVRQWHCREQLCVGMSTTERAPSYICFAIEGSKLLNGMKHLKLFSAVQ